MKKTLWTGDFSRITIATVLSAIGGEAMNLPLSLLVFQETQSTRLAAILLVCGMLPDIVLPVLIAPIAVPSILLLWLWWHRLQRSCMNMSKCITYSY